MGATGVVTEVVTVEEGAISHTVLAEGAFVPSRCLVSQGSLYTSQGARSGILNFSQQKYRHTREETLPPCIYAIPCTCRRHKVYTLLKD